jgi:hypothetical protein
VLDVPDIAFPQTNRHRLLSLIDHRASRSQLWDFATLIVGEKCVVRMALP